MKTKELNQLTVEELQKEKGDLLKEQFNMRIQKSTGQFTRFHLMKDVRRNIARINTILAEKQKKGE